ncbi:MAG: heavy metal-binding domain-containing protein [Microbacterium sp.]|uniref:Heavy metal-binding domain-containing protein n=1 Tax=Microbacterium ginsengisoli TaxID=400772 RepID=A0A3C1KFB5_9MICO|nr:heavy metal-binding domain-containing protein [Microbacterium sp.]HAN24916.1 heavy metal-binding domain-containing protein [Microbacterium ginsengisoli]
MKAPARLGLYGAGLVAVFAVAFATAGAIVPDETVQAWTEQSSDHGAHNDEDRDDMNSDGGHVGHDSGASSLGLGVAQDGYQLTGVSAPTTPGTEGELSLTVTGPDGKPVTDFETEHEKELHLIVVRADGQQFRHVHPRLDAGGTWSIPWQWDAAGTYRVFADFVPAEYGEGITLSTNVQVGGDYEPVAAEPAAETSVDGFDVAVTGDLVASESSTLIVTITRDGQPVSALEPYLGAFGHLVALRDGDLAYLHVHPHGDAPQAGQTSGPEIVFEATAPTAGRYLLFLDFQVDGQVRTAPLVIDTTGTDSDGAAPGKDSDTDNENSEDEDHDH